jgi:hypothetical protein
LPSRRRSLKSLRRATLQEAVAVGEERDEERDKEREEEEKWPE